MDTPPDSIEEDARLAEAMRIAPRGAFALAGFASLLVFLGWLAVYLLVFIPRGMVG